ncbi:MAG: T9SS type A sorting domain-containing protein [Bacteroidales bacterium]|nr:T9SS type A sorting domain-containing protein [Bacteroidales bacterium]
MKKSLLFMALAMAFCLASNAQTTVWSDNFDGYTAPTSLTTVGYDVWEGTANAVDAAANGITAVSGANVAKCHSGSSLNIYLRKTIELEGGKQYTYSASTMQADGKKHFIQVVVDGSTLKAEGTNTSWQSKSITFTPSVTQDVVLTTYMYFKELAMYVDDMKLTMDTPTSIKDAETINLSVTPNPSNGIYRISASETLASVEVYNTAGQLVKSLPAVNAEKVTLDMSASSRGLYVLKLEATNGNYCTKKIMLK